MNKIFRVIWNQSMQTWMAVSELSKGKAKSSSTSDVNVEVNRSDKKFWMVSVLSILSMIAVFPVWAATSTNNNIVSDNTIPNRNLAVGTATATGGTASKGASVAMGVVVNATGQDSVAVGSEVTAQHSQDIALGSNVSASGNQSVAIGNDVVASGRGSIAIGSDDVGTNSTYTVAGQTFELNNAAGTATAYVTPTASGLGSVVVGSLSIANSSFSSVLGTNARATGAGATALGAFSDATAEGTVAVGLNATAGQVNATAIGTNATASHQRTVAIGLDSTALFMNATAIGSLAHADKEDAIAIGAKANTTGNSAVAIGKSANSSAQNSIAIGNGESKTGASGDNSIVLGAYGVANQSNATAIGRTANAVAQDAIAIGRQANASLAGSLALGSDSTTDTAVPPTTLNYNFTNASGGTVTATAACSTASSVVSVGTSKYARKITNVAAGTINAASTEAVNGSQLYNVVTNVGFNVQENDSAKSRVNNNNVVNFANGAYTTANVTGTSNTTVKFNVVNQAITTTNGVASATGTAGLATAADVVKAVNNTGFNLQANGASNSFVKSGDTVNFKQGDNILVTKSGNDIIVATSMTPNFTTLTTTGNASIGGNLDMTNGKIANLANATGSGDAVNLSQLKANTTKVVSGKNITITNATSADGTTYTINADDTSASVSTDSSLLTVTPNGSTAVGNATVTDYKVSLTQGSLTNSNGVTSATNGVATAQDVAKAINAGYWKVGNNTGIETAQIKFGDQVNFVNGKGTVSNVTGANVSFDVNVDGKTINVGSDGKLTVNTSALPKGVSVEAGKNTTVTSKAGTNGETIYTVDAEKTTASAGSNAITVEAGSKDANGVTNYSVDLSQTTKDQLAKADTAIQSFTTSVNGTQAETINKDNKDVNFVNGTGTTAEAKGSDITFNVKTTTLTTTDGKVEAGDKGDSFAKAGDVAEAINNASKAAKTEVKEGDNIVVTSEKGTDGQTIYTVKTAKDLVVDSVKAGDSTLNTNGLTIANGAAGQPVSLTKNGLNNGGNKITNVANGTVGAGSTDAVNGGQLQDVISKGFKINADNGTEDTVSLEESVKFTGNAGNIVTTVTNNTIAFALANNIKVGAANPITINGDAGTISGLTNKTFDPNNIVSGQAATEDQLKVVATTANSALQDFTTSVNGNVVETINKDSKDVNFVNGTGTTAAIANGSDITFNVNKSGLTTDAAGNVTADKTGDNFATAGDVANAINKASKATKTEVKEGDNIEVTSETGTNGQTIYTITTAKDLVVNTITTGGTVLNNNGLTINGGPSITRSGINAGDQKITSVAAGNISSTSTEAVNGSQLYQLQEAAKAAKTEVVAGKNTTVTSETGNNGQTIYTVNADKSVVEAKTDSGLTVTAITDADNYTTTYMLDLDEKTKKQLAKEETVKAGSSNIVVSEGTNSTGGKEFTVDLAKDIAVDTLKVGDTVNIDANGINAGNTKITGVATGTDDTDAVNVKQLTDTIAAAKTTVSSTDSSIVVVSSGNNYDISVKTDSATIRNGSNGLEVVTGDISTNSNGQAEVASGDETKVATAGTIKKAVNNASWTVKADKVKGTNGDATAYTGGDKVKAGDTVSVNAGNNIVISGSGKNINIATSDTPTFKSVTAKSVTADEVNITDGPSINTNGIDMNNKRITNVAPGRAGTNDVVNMNQLGDAIGNVNNKIHSVDKKLRSGIAGSVAIGSLVQAYNPSDTLLAVGGGTYRGASALALGYSKVSDNGKIIIKATGSVNNAGHYMGGASVGYRF